MIKKKKKSFDGWAISFFVVLFANIILSKQISLLPLPLRIVECISLVTSLGALAIASYEKSEQSKANEGYIAIKISKNMDRCGSRFDRFITEHIKDSSSPLDYQLFAEHFAEDAILMALDKKEAEEESR